MVSTMVTHFLSFPKITTPRLFSVMASIRHWPLHQLDVKNVILNGDLKKKTYMKRTPGFVVQGECGLVCKLCWSFGLKHSEADHLVFYWHISGDKCIHNCVYWWYNYHSEWHHKNFLFKETFMQSLPNGRSWMT